MKSLEEYVQIASDLYGNSSHAVTWITAQISNKGTLEMSDESMMKLLDRMDQKTAVKTAAAQLPEPEPEAPKARDQGAIKGLFDGLKNNPKT
jgi:protein-arginine kinase